MTSFHDIAQRSVALAAQHLATRADAPVYQRVPPETRDLILGLPLPTEPIAPGALLDFFERAILPYPMGNGSPRFMGWVNSPPAHAAVACEILAAAMNPSCAGGDHAAIYLEHAILRWIRELVGFPLEGSAALLTSGGSMASLTALAAARHRALESLGVNVREDGLCASPKPLALYATSQTHGCVRKSVELLGLGSKSIRAVACDAEYRMDPADLQRAIAHDRASGMHPFCVVATAGSVNTGAIDRFRDVARICREEDLWLHVDGAYGAFGILDPSVRPLYEGFDLADSLALDPHKWLSTPVDCGCVLVRDAQLLRDAFSLVPPYLRTEPGKGIGGLPWFSEYGFEQTRSFRALKLWLTISAAGRSGLAARVARNIELGRILRKKIANAPDFDLTAPGPLSIVCFRYLPAGTRDPAAIDALNKRIMEDLQASGEAFLTSAELDGGFSLRACILHYATSEVDLDFLLEAIRRMASS